MDYMAFVAYRPDKESKEDIHCIPEFKGEGKHELSGECWCEPRLDDYTSEGGSRLFVHNRPE